MKDVFSSILRNIGSAKGAGEFFSDKIFRGK